MKRTKKILRNRWFYFIQLVVDTAIIVLSYYFGFVMQRPELFRNGIPMEVIVSLAVIAVLSLLFILAFQLHKCGKKPYSTVLFYALLTMPFIAFASVFIDFAIKGVGIWRRTIFYSLVIQIPVYLLVKYIFYKIHGAFIRPLKSIIVENNLAEASRIFLRLSEINSSMYDVRYLIDDDHTKIFEYIDKSNQVIIGSSSKRKTELVEYCAINNIDCTIVPDYTEIILNSGKFNNINDIMLCDMKVKLDIEARFVKRTIDIVSSILSIVVLSPAMLIVALAIKIQDGGSVFFRQTRMTKDNQEFTLYKFRTMVEDAEKDTGAVLATLNDERITKVGRFLRACRLDEIPQFFNVLLGEMSLVGPRPERPSLIEETVKEVPEFAYRTLVKAGITGLAQTMGRYDTSFPDKLRFDLFYVNNYSLILDLKIVFYTFHTLFTPSVANGLDRIQSDDEIIEMVRKKGYHDMDGKVMEKNNT